MTTKILSALLSLVLMASLSSAQTIQITDTNMVNFLELELDSSCFVFPVGSPTNEIYANCPDWHTKRNIYYKTNFFPTTDYTPLQNFDSLFSLRIDGIFINNTLPEFTNTIRELIVLQKSTSTGILLPKTYHLPDSLRRMTYNSYHATIEFPQTPSKMQYLKWNAFGYPPGVAIVDSLPNVDSIHFEAYPSLPWYIDLVIKDLPDSLRFLDIWYSPNTNEVRIEGELPSTLEYFDVMNLGGCLSEIPYDIQYCNLAYNTLQCLPNYVPAMAPYLLNKPLCVDYDPIGNGQQCETSYGISGTVFNDLDSNCVLDSAFETTLAGRTLTLYDTSGQIVAACVTGNNGKYHLAAPLGSYLLVLDSIGSGSAGCNGYQRSVSMNYLNPTPEEDFPVFCETGIDLEVNSMVPWGWVFPGQTHTLTTFVGNIFQNNGVSCADSAGGQLKLIVDGPVQYVGAPGTALMPDSVFGDTICYRVDDWSLINLPDDFELLFSTDTTAQSGDSVCVQAIVTENTGADTNPSNDTLTFCYPVLNSYDPNDKLVFPPTLEPESVDPLTYTVRFQNTGSAPAFNIKIVDSLPSNLDIASFELLSASHDVRINFSNEAAIFYFNDIMLPDSGTNQEGSNGFVQFRLQPQAGQLACTEIANRAFIYFDFNPPIITNTAITKFNSDLTAQVSQSLPCVSGNPAITTLNPQGGTAPFLFRLNGASATADSTFMNLNPGAYAYTITDSTGCIHSDSFSVQNVAVGMNFDQEIYCVDSATSVVISAQVGVGPFTYSSDGVNYQVSDTLPVPPSGVHAYWIMDSMGCVLQDTLVPLYNHVAVDLTLVPPCNGDSTLLTISPLSGITPFTFALNHDAPQVSNAFNVPVNSTHLLTSRDSLGCPVLDTFTTGAAVSALPEELILCDGASNWLLGSENTGTTTLWNQTFVGDSFQVNTDGFVFAQITTANGQVCFDSTLVSYDSLDATHTILANTCSGIANGSVQFNGENGYPPYTYWFQQSAPGNVVNNLGGGVYYFAVEDSLGCTVLDTFEILSLPKPISLITVTPSTGTDGIIEIQPQAGDPPFQFSLNNQNYQPGAIFTGLAPGNFTVSVLDSNQCQWSDSTIVSSIVNLGEMYTEFKIYPNPSEGKFKIQWSQGSFSGGRVLDGKGRTITKVQPTEEKEITLDLKGNAKGVYLLQMNFENRVIFKRLILN